MRYFLVKEPQFSAKGKFIYDKPVVYSEEDIFEDHWESYQQDHPTPESDSFMAEYVSYQQQFLEAWITMNSAKEVSKNFYEWMAERDGEYSRSSSYQTLVETGIANDPEWVWNDIVYALLQEAYNAGQQSVVELVREAIEEDNISILKKVFKC